MIDYDKFSIQPCEWPEEDERGHGWITMDRDLIHAARKHKANDGKVRGLFDNQGQYWRVESGVDAVFFTPVANGISTGSKRMKSVQEFRKEFC